VDRGRENYNFQKYIVLLGVSLFFLKFAAWFYTGSVAVLTDALESIVNVVAGSIGLYALYVSSKPKDRDHPYGHGKVEFISASVEGAMICFAGLLILMESFNRILNPHEISNLDVGIFLIALSAVLNFIAGSRAVKKGEKNRSQALIASGRHLRSDTYSSLGILIGLVLMYSLQHLGHEVGWLDGAVACLFGIIILLTGAKVLKDSFDGIMDKADNELLEQVVGCLREHRHNDWIEMYGLRILKVGGRLHIDLCIVLPYDMTVREQHFETCEAKKAITERFGKVVELTIMSEPCHKYSCRNCYNECSERREPFLKESEWTVESITRP
jgi:cation diffusion facilitator family transporter